jgi:hypothetical protein
MIELVQLVAYVHLLGCLTFIVLTVEMMARYWPEFMKDRRDANLDSLSPRIYYVVMLVGLVISAQAWWLHLPKTAYLALIILLTKDRG